MHRPRFKIISIFILLLSWSFFVPLFSANLNSADHHEISMQLVPCDMDNCNIQTANPCTTHCEGFSAILITLDAKQLENQRPLNFLEITSSIHQQYIAIELKPPKNIEIV